MSVDLKLHTRHINDVLVLYVSGRILGKDSNKFREKLYKEFFGLGEQSTKSSSMFHVSADDVTNMQKMAAAAKQLKQNF